MSDVFASVDATLLAQATELAPDGVAIVNMDGTIVYANRSLAEMSRIPHLVGTAVDDLVPDESRPGHATMRAAYQRRPNARPMGVGMQLGLRRSDGVVIPVEISLNLLEHDQPYVIAVVRDISERVESQQRLASADEQLMLAAERERIGRDLHDVVLQHLYGMGLAVQATAVSADNPIGERLEQIVDEIDHIIAEVRTIVFTLGSAHHSGSLGQELGEVVAQATRLLGFTPALRLTGPVESAMSPEVRIEMIASLREALGNVARHAKARSARVEIRVRGDRIEMEVVDNGVGPPSGKASSSGGHGLANLAARAAALDGDCALEAGDGGTGARLRWSARY